MAPRRRQWWLVAALLLCALLFAQLADVDAKKPTKTKAAATPSQTPEATSPAAPKSERDNDPTIQKVRGLRNAAMRDNDRKSYPSAIEKLREALTELNDRVFGEGRLKVKESEQSMDAALYAQLLSDYGSVLIRAKQYDEAIEVLGDAVEMTKRVYGESHPSLGLSLRSLADALLAKKEYKLALEKYRLLRSHVRKGLGVTHEGYIEVQLKMAEIYKSQNNVKKAVKLLKSVLDEQGEEVNGATQGIGELYMELATLQLKLEDVDGAERAAQAARVIMRTRDGESSLNHAFSLNALAGVKMSQGKVKESYELLQQAHAIAVEIYGKDHAMARASAKTLDQVKMRLDQQLAQDFLNDHDEHEEL